jgi:hypothetical protein
MNIDRQLIWSMYQEIGAIERHFNELESGYRTMASTWLLAAFGSIGFILTVNSGALAWKDLVIGGIGFSASVGLYLLWTLDLLVYHRLLDSAFIEGKRLEAKHKWLPQVRHNMMRLQGGKGVMQKLVLFYLLSTEVMLATGTVGVATWARKSGKNLVFTCLAVGFLLMVAVAVRIWVATRSTFLLDGEILSPPKQLENDEHFPGCLLSPEYMAPNPGSQADG